MAQPKFSLYEMASAVGDAAFTARGHVDRWNRDHPDAPLPSDNEWVKVASALGSAHLVLSLMALDEDASRKFVASLMGRDDAKLLVAMLTPARPKKTEAEAA